MLGWEEAGGKEEVRDELMSLAPMTSLLTCHFVRGDHQEGGSAGGGGALCQEGGPYALMRQILVGSWFC